MSILTTQAWADAYVAPVCCKVTIRSRIDNSILHEFNSFDTTNNDIALGHVQITKALGQTGTFTLGIDDSIDNVIDLDKVDCGNLVTVQLGRNTADFRNVFNGYTESIVVNRKGPPGLLYTISGLGTGAYANQIIVNVEKSAPLDPDGKPIQSSQYLAYLLMDELFSSSDFLPLRKSSVAEICGFTLDKISDKVNEFIPNLSFNYVYASQVASAIADLVGADWYIDDNNSVVFQYSNIVHSGIKVKTIFESSDLAYNTSYILNGYTMTHSIAPSQGFGNQFIGIADIALGQVASAAATDAANSFTSLFHKDVAQQVPLSSSKFSNLGLKLSKTGMGTSETDPLTAKLFGRILLDNNNTPDGDGELARFTIPISSVLEQPSVIFKLDLQFKSDALSTLSSGENIWIVLYSIGDSEENTCRWWHDNLINKRASNYNAMRTLPYGRTAKSFNLSNKQDNDSIYSNFGWYTSLNGPTYSYNVVSKVAHLNITRNMKSINRWGRVDVKIDVPTLSDTDKTQMQYMNSILQQSSKKVVTFSTPEVTIPLQTFFIPGTCIQFIDPLVGYTADKNIQAQIHEVRYNLDANATNESPLGTNKCEITPVWFMNAGDFLNNT
jgi:hypothetical protein